MADWNAAGAVCWTQNHGFSIGGEVNFTSSGDSLDWTGDIPFSIGGLSIHGGNINYNMNGVSGRDTMLVRVSILGDPAGGDAGGGPGSVLLINKALYVIGQQAESEIMPFTVQLDHGALPVPPDGSAYKLHIAIWSVGAISSAHFEIALAGMWRPQE